jgi:uncharacterized protein YndB with AHSA1/START domain
MNNAATFSFAPQADREIVVKRLFDAPRDLVWRCFTEPGLITRWMSGPPAGPLTIRAMDFKIGGAYRWEWRLDATGAIMGLSGVFQDISRPQRIVHTENWAQPYSMGETVVTTGFADQDGKTAATIAVRYQMPAARDAMVKSGMAGGMSQCYARLDAFLKSADIHQAVS